MNYKEFNSHLEKGELGPAYFFVGPEDFLIENCVKSMIDLAVDPSTREFNLDVFYGSETDGGKIVDTAIAYPMLSDSRMVVVKEVQKLSASGLDLLAKYLEKPVPSTRLVLTCPKIDFRNKAFSQIKSKSAFVEFKSLYDREIPGWIQGYLSQKKLKITHEASNLIHARVGNNLRTLANELDKIVLNLGEKKTIEETDVQTVVGLSRSFSGFNLNDAIGYKDLTQSLTILNLMLESGESPTVIVAMITRHFINLLKIKGAATKNKSDKEISAQTGISPFFVGKSKQMARNYPLTQFPHIFRSLLKADLDLKTSQQPPEIALQTLLIQIMR